MTIPQMFERSRRLAVLTVAAAFWIAALLSFAILASSGQAEQTYQSFGATNYIAANTTITSMPTNSPGTNGLNRQTGGWVSVENNERSSFVFFSEPVASNTTNNITFALVRAYRNPVTLSSNSVAGNGTFAAFAGCETLPSLTFTVAQNGTNATTWATNLDSYTQGGVAAVGIYSMADGYSSTALTNFDAGLSKKIVPIVYK